jgi:hypothetical protein
VRTGACALVAADRERTERVAVIALAPRYEMVRSASPISTKYWRASFSAPPWLPTARDKVDVVQPFGRSLDQWSASASETSLVKKLVCA